MENRGCAFLVKNRCQILKVNECPTSACRFCKTSAQILESRNKANTKLAMLDILRQKEIAENYYGGKLVWLKGGVACGR